MHAMAVSSKALYAKNAEHRLKGSRSKPRLLLCQEPLADVFHAPIHAKVGCPSRLWIAICSRKDSSLLQFRRVRRKRQMTPRPNYQSGSSFRRLFLSLRRKASPWHPPGLQFGFPLLDQGRLRLSRIIPGLLVPFKRELFDEGG